MTGDQTASLIYLVLLGTVIGSYFFVAGRLRLGETLRQAGLWVLIFIGVIAGYGLWSDIQTTVMPRQSVFAQEGRIEVPRSADGHYHMVLDVNGTPVRFVVDTGASDLVLTREDAARAGIDTGALAFVGSARTANGSVATARVWLDSVALGPIVDKGVPALVNGGEMSGSLLGMSYLDRFAQVSIANGRLVLTR